MIYSEEHHAIFEDFRKQRAGDAWNRLHPELRKEFEQIIQRHGSDGIEVFPLLVKAFESFDSKQRFLNNPQSAFSDRLPPLPVASVQAPPSPISGS